MKMSLLVVTLAALALAACGKKEAPPAPAMAPAPVAAPAPAAAAPADAAKPAEGAAPAELKK